MKKIYILDTTLRDGEQVPGAKLNLNEKLEVARELVKLEVDMMEVGFLSSSKGDFEAVKAISKKVGQDVIVTALVKEQEIQHLKKLSWELSFIQNIMMVIPI